MFSGFITSLFQSRGFEGIGFRRDRGDGYSFQPCASWTESMADKNAVPRLGFVHDFVGEHATVPADVSARFQHVAMLVAQPVAGSCGDVQFAVGIVRQAMPAGLVVAAGPVHGGVVLGDVEIDRPGPQRVGQFFSAASFFSASFQSKSSGRIASSGAL